MVEIKKLVPHKHADVIKAFADGKQIQYKDRFDGEWRNICESPLFMIDGEYRIKPEVVKPKWPTFDLPREIFLTLIDEYECDGPTITGVSNVAIAHALETGLVVLPETTVEPTEVGYKKGLDGWGGVALVEALNEFVKIHKDKEYGSIMDLLALKAAILKYLEVVEEGSK